MIPTRFSPLQLHSQQILISFPFQILSEFIVIRKASLTKIAMEDKVSESASGMVRGMEKAYHEFVVENYSLRKGIGVNQPIESDQFVVGGHPWTIYFYPDGKEDAANNVGYASLYVNLKSESIEPVEFLCELYILDQTGKGRHWGVSSFEGRNTYRLVQSLRPGFMTGNLRAISRALLESPVYGYVKDDCLKIRATIGVFTYHIQKDQNQTLIKVPKSNIGGWGDVYVFFKVAHQRFCAHKLILAARCPALLSRLSDVHQLQDIVIPDMEPKVFKAVLWFVYKGTLHKKDQEAINDSGPLVFKSFLAEMLAAADQFELKRLKEICESHILKKVSGESAGYLLHLADVCHAAELKSACLRFTSENQAVITESDGCEYLKETCTSLFLELAGFKNNPCTSIERVLNLCNKVLSTFKESLVGRRWPWGATYKKHKRKEV